MKALSCIFLASIFVLSGRAAYGGTEVRQSLTDVAVMSCSENLCYELSASRGQMSQVGDIMYFAASSGAVRDTQGEMLFRWSDAPSYLDFSSNMLVIQQGQGHAEAKYFQLQP